MSNRREFITLFGGAAATWPLAARAQQVERVRRIAALISYTEDNAEVQRWVAAFHDGLQKLGWVEGRNLQIDQRWGGTDMNMLQRLAKEIVATKPDLIFSTNSPTTRILKQETTTIPIVFGNLVDPIGQGFVASLARPGGNVTGFVNLEPSVTGKIRRRRRITKSISSPSTPRPHRLASCRSWRPFAIWPSWKPSWPRKRASPTPD